MRFLDLAVSLCFLCVVCAEKEKGHKAPLILLKPEPVYNCVPTVIFPDSVKTQFKKEIMCCLALFPQIT